MKSKQEFKVGDLVRKHSSMSQIIKITKEPTATIMNIPTTVLEIVPFSELATYAHFCPVTRIGRPPKTKKVAIPDLRSLEAEMKEMMPKPEQASTPETAPPVDKIMERQHQDWEEEQAQSPGSDTCPSVPDLINYLSNPEGQQHEAINPKDIDKPTKVDLSTFDMRVGVTGEKHQMTLSGKTVRGKDLKPTLLRLLNEVGITGSDAEIEATLVLHPDSEGRNRMIDIVIGRPDKAGD